MRSSAKPILAVAVYILLWLLLHSVFQYLLDSDATAYLTIAEQAAKGNWQRSVNGLWSPLNGWLLVPFIKMGFQPWMIAKVLNAVVGGVVLLLAYKLIVRFDEKTKIAPYLLWVLPVVLVYYAYYQIFGDLMQVAFALGYFLLLTSKGFFGSWPKIISASILMGIGFYAKAYSLPFFILHFSACLFFAWRQNEISLGRALQSALVAFATIVLLVLPWSFQLQEKYGEFSLTGFAGKLNMSWYINSGKSFKSDIDLIIPPVYDDAVSFWEDPYLTQEGLVSPTTSSHHFKRWVLRVGHTTLTYLLCTMRISIFYLPFLLMGLFALYKRKHKNLKATYILLGIFILPLGYLMMHIETRYIWLSTFLMMAYGAWFIQGKLDASKSKNWMWMLFAISFLIYPIYNGYQMRYKNKELFDLADELNTKGFEGKFVSNPSAEGDLWVVAYLTKTQNYTIEQSRFVNEDLIAEMQGFGVENFLYFKEGKGQLNMQPEIEEGVELILTKESIASAADSIGHFVLEDSLSALPAQWYRLKSGLSPKP